jgi:hypothetical protein
MTAGLLSCVLHARPQRGLHGLLPSPRVTLPSQSHPGARPVTSSSLRLGAARLEVLSSGGLLALT